MPVVVIAKSDMRWTTFQRKPPWYSVDVITPAVGGMRLNSSSTT